MMPPLTFETGPNVTKNARIRFGCSVVIPDDQGRILLQKRTDGDWWSLPAGGMDPGETPTQTAIREVREETGLEVELVRFLGLYSNPELCTVYPDGNRRQMVGASFLGRVIGGQLIQSNEETAELRWFGPDELPQNITHTSLARIRGYLAGDHCHVD
jgi:8-oxo-dGTP pyrophosphatase MutT (NUDIX family)